MVIIMQCTLLTSELPKNMQRRADAVRQSDTDNENVQLHIQAQIGNYFDYNQ
jgi:hypothetical protein